MSVLVLGDSYMGIDVFEAAFADVAARHNVRYVQLTHSDVAPRTLSERTIRESQGDPVEVARYAAGVEIIVCHGAPITAEVIDAAHELRLICCARGGPVNVDVAAASSRGVPVVTTPGKNAEAVADLTLAFMIMLGRDLSRAQRFLADGGELKTAFDGARFVGVELSDRVVGLVGYGHVGRRVVHRAVAFGMTTLVFDPFVAVESTAGVRQVNALDQLLRESDFVSLHARATSENENLFDAETFGKMKRGAYFVNTARETLVDEEALTEALTTGHLAGAALDVVRHRSGRGRHPLLEHPKVIVTPHIGGATQETLRRGAQIVADAIMRFAAGEPVEFVNREHVGACT